MRWSVDRSPQNLLLETALESPHPPPPHPALAGSRESEEPGIHSWVIEVLENAFFWSENHPGILGGPGEG